MASIAEFDLINLSDQELRDKYSKLLLANASELTKNEFTATVAMFQFNAYTNEFSSKF